MLVLGSHPVCRITHTVYWKHHLLQSPKIQWTWVNILVVSLTVGGNQRGLNKSKTKTAAGTQWIRKHLPEVWRSIMTWNLLVHFLLQLLPEPLSSYSNLLFAQDFSNCSILCLDLNRMLTGRLNCTMYVKDNYMIIIIYLTIGSECC